MEIFVYVGRALTCMFRDGDVKIDVIGVSLHESDVK